MFVLAYNAGMNHLTTTQAATILGVSLRAVQQLITRGQLQAERIGRDYLIDPVALEPFRTPSGRGRPRAEKPGKIHRGKRKRA